MGTKHNLSLEIPVVHCEDSLIIWDTSSYASSLSIDCERLEIKAPGSAIKVYIEVDNNFKQTVTAEDLGYSYLTDGVYEITYSVSPNDKAYVTYYHLRISKLENRWFKEMCKISHECPDEDRIKDLMRLRALLYAAKAKAEYCHAPEAASEMYKYVDKELQKIEKTKCKTC